MNYLETLDYLYRRLPMYQRQGGAALKKDLTNIRRLLAALGHPERRMGRILHVAGTNGKGTTCHLLAAALQAEGQRVGLYTSPHYRDFRERIKINGALVPQGEVVDFVARHRELIETVEPSFFEITVAMAFDYFARREVDWAVVEVGLGGRLDSTNVVTPVLSVITNIGLDHTQFLGETLAEIAGEKAGIIKPGVPVVIGERQEETTTVFTERAGSNRLVFASDRPLPETIHGGPHFAKNLRTAAVAFDLLHDRKEVTGTGRTVVELADRFASMTYFLGRWQVLQTDPTLIIADSAHNHEGLRPVLAKIDELCRGRGGRGHYVLGVVNDKDLSRVLPLLPREADYYFVKADIPRGLPANDLRVAAGRYGLNGETYPSVVAGYAAARAAARPEDVVFIGGSIFTVAEVIPVPS